MTYTLPNQPTVWLGDEVNDTLQVPDSWLADLWPADEPDVYGPDDGGPLGEENGK